MEETAEPIPPPSPSGRAIVAASGSCYFPVNIRDNRPSSDLSSDIPAPASSIREDARCAGPVSGRPPDLRCRLDDQRQLALLVVDGEGVALDRAGEAALRGEGHAAPAARSWPPGRCGA